ncbi:4-oxalocrotonate tautomerase family protein [soil metagenome]
MPFVNIRMVAGQSDAAKDKIAASTASAISEATGIARDQIWITFEDIAAQHWYVGDRSVSEIRKKR